MKYSICSLAFFIMVLLTPFKESNSLKSIYPKYAKNEIVIEHLSYTVSFNSEHHIANWVAWNLTKENLKGITMRTNEFAKDPDLRVEYICPCGNEYKNTGYDRGHMCPADDNKWNDMVMKESFYMTNIIPQLSILNNGNWKILENKCREWTKSFNSIFIICGPIFNPNSGMKIGDDIKIYVPKIFFKIIYYTKDNKHYAIGYVIAQDNSWFIDSVDNIEKRTGLDFFSNLPISIQEEMESKEKPSEEEWPKYALKD